jgi:hypothetical protein
MLVKAKPKLPETLLDEQTNAVLTERTEVPVLPSVGTLDREPSLEVLEDAAVSPREDPDEARSKNTT